MESKKRIEEIEEEMKEINRRRERNERKIQEIEEEMKETTKRKEKLSEGIKIIDAALFKLEELKYSGEMIRQMGFKKLLERVIKHKKRIFPAKLFYDDCNEVVPDGNQWKSKKPSNKKGKINDETAFDGLLSF